MGFKILVFCAAMLATTAAASTSEHEARACFDEALDAAKAGAKPSELITKYLDYRSIAANAAAYTKYRSWDAVPESVKEKMVTTAREWFADESTYADLDLNTVKAIRGGKANGSSYELPARYGKNGNFVFFGLMIHYDGTCRVIDVSESNAWLSFVIGQQF